MTWQAPDQQVQQPPSRSMPQSSDRPGIDPAWTPPSWAPPAQPAPTRQSHWSVIVIGILGALVLVLGGLLLIVTIAWLGATSSDQPPPDALEPAPEVPARFADGQPVGAVGDTARWGDQFEVTVTGVRQQPATEDAAGVTPGHVLVVVKLQVANLGAAPLSHAPLVTGRYGPEGTEAESAFDEGITKVFGEIPPGTTASGEYGLSVPPEAVGEVLVQVYPDSEFAPASWKVGVTNPS